MTNRPPRASAHSPASGPCSPDRCRRPSKSEGFRSFDGTPARAIGKCDGCRAPDMPREDSGPQTVDEFDPAPRRSQSGCPVVPLRRSPPISVLLQGERARPCPRAARERSIFSHPPTDGTRRGIDTDNASAPARIPAPRHLGADAARQVIARPLQAEAGDRREAGFPRLRSRRARSCRSHRSRCLPGCRPHGLHARAGFWPDGKPDACANLSEAQRRPGVPRMAKRVGLAIERGPAPHAPSESVADALLWLNPEKIRRPRKLSTNPPPCRIGPGCDAPSCWTERAQVGLRLRSPSRDCGYRSDCREVSSDCWPDPVAAARCGSTSTTRSRSISL